MKRIWFVVFLLLLTAVSAVAIYGNIRGKLQYRSSVDTAPMPGSQKENNTVPADTLAPSAFEKVSISDLEKTGFVKDCMPIKNNDDFRAGVTEEEIPIDNTRSVVFRYVCETGLNETEPGQGIETKLLRYSCRKTLLILLKDKTSGEEEEIQRYQVKMYENDVSSTDEQKTERLNYPYILDAVLSDDGAILRYIIKCNRFSVDVRELHLDEGNWMDQILIKQRNKAVFSQTAVPFTGDMQQAYFALPDVINVSCSTGMNYSLKICEKDMLGASSLQNLLDENINKRMCLDCIYWNEVGKKDYLKTLFSKESVFDNEANKYVKKSCLDKTLTAEPPVPTDRDWEGWHKLERNIN